MSKLGAKCWRIIETVLRFIIYGILKIFHKRISDNQWKEFLQFVKFGLVGLSNTVISYLSYAILVWLGLFYLLSNVLAFIISVLNSFYWNNKYVFKLGKNESRSLLQSLAKTFVAYGFTGLVLSSFLLFLWVDLLHISQFVAPLINLIVTIPLNYLINKFWAFKKEKKNEDKGI